MRNGVKTIASVVLLAFAPCVCFSYGNEARWIIQVNDSVESERASDMGRESARATGGALLSVSGAAIGIGGLLLYLDHLNQTNQDAKDFEMMMGTGLMVLGGASITIGVSLLYRSRSGSRAAIQQAHVSIGASLNGASSADAK